MSTRLWLLLLCWLALPAAGQQVTLEPSAASRCLAPPEAQRGTPDYPFDAWKRGLPGRVKVEFQFTVPDGPPTVHVIESEGDPDFIGAVREHARTLRLPCPELLTSPVRLAFEFAFVPDRRQVLWSHPADLADPDRRQRLKCVRHLSGEKAPVYPDEARRAAVAGRVLARLRFESADHPPRAEVFGRHASRLLQRQIRNWVEGYRMPCHDGAAVEGVWTFEFMFDGDKAYGLRSVTLQQLLRLDPRIDTTRLMLDTTTMGCPFEMRMRYRQPFMRNTIGEFGNTNAARQPLADWLSGLELALPARQLDAAFGDTTTVAVPCMKIDLKPKEQ